MFYIKEVELMVLCDVSGVYDIANRCMTCEYYPVIHMPAWHVLNVLGAIEEIAQSEWYC